MAKRGPYGQKLMDRLEGTGLIPVARASELTGIPERTLYNYFTSGAVKGTRVGARVLLDARSLGDHLGPEVAALLDGKSKTA